MTNKKILILIFVVASLTLLIGCLPGLTPPTPKGVISGRIMVPSSETTKDITGWIPVANATVTLTDSSGITHTVTTDEDGYYTFTNIAVNANTIITATAAIDGNTVIVKDVIPQAVAADEDYNAKTADAESTALALIVEELLEQEIDPEDINLEEIQDNDSFTEVVEQVSSILEENGNVTTDSGVTNIVDYVAGDIINPPAYTPPEELPEPEPEPEYTPPVTPTVNFAPIADAGPDRIVVMKTSVEITFVDTGSDPDGTVVSYFWDFGDDNTGTGATVSHTYNAFGTYTVTLMATDNSGATSSDTIILKIFDNITDAIDDASDGNTIEVALGTYNENLLIDKALTLKSTDGATGTIIHGDTLYMIKIRHSDVIFEGFTVTKPDFPGKSDTSGILVDTIGGESVSNVQILDNIITQMGTPGQYGAAGINIGNATNTLSDIVISGNTITDIKTLDDQGSSPSDHTCGINIWDGASNVVISYNTISNIKYNGIILEGASNVQIYENDITSCESGIRVNPRGSEISNIQINDNDITGCEYGISVVRLESYVGEPSYPLSDLTINLNNLFNNTGYGVFNDTDYLIDATNNWWGDATGPNQPTTNSGGLGNAVSNNVDYSSYSDILY